MESTPDVMDIGLFDKIITKADSDGFTMIAFYNWTEPFLNRNLAEYVKIVKRHNPALACVLSSNLSIPSIPHLEAVLSGGST